MPDGASCGTGRTCCGGFCTNTRTDVRNCGGCGQTCSPGNACFAGRCFAACDVCATGCAFSSVQAAIDAAPTGDTVTLCPGTYPGQVTIGKNITILGLGDTPSDVVLSNPSATILGVDAGVAVTVRNLTVTGVNGAVSPAIRSFGGLTLREVRVVDNVCFNSSAISNRRSEGFVGGVLTLVDCLVGNNQSAGISTESETTLTLVRTRVEGNSPFPGAGIANFSGAVFLTDNSVVTGNTANGSPPAGGGIRNQGGTVSIDATSSVSGNSPDDCVNVSGGTGCP
jgi:hypothetical protein